MSSILFSALHCLLSASGVCYAIEIQYHHVAQWWIKDLWYLCSVMFVCRLVISVQGVIIIDLSFLGCIVPEILKSITKYNFADSVSISEALTLIFGSSLCVSVLIWSVKVTKLLNLDIIIVFSVDLININFSSSW